MNSLTRPSAERRSRFGPKLLRPTLLVSTLAGTILIGGQAQAVTQSISCTINQGLTNPCNLTPGSDFGTLGDKQIVFQGFDIDPEGTIAVNVVYNWFDTLGDGPGNYADDIWTFAVSAAPSVTGPLSLTYSYDVNIVESGWAFDKLSLESDVVTSNNTRVVKLSSPENSDLTSLNGTPDGPKDYIFLNDYTTIRVTDNVNLQGSADILTSVTNSWTQRPVTVPGPLPILGAGVAFGMSRKLRRRIAAHSNV